MDDIHPPEVECLPVSILHSHSKIDRFAKWKREALKTAAKRSETFLRLFNLVKTNLVRLIIMGMGGWRLDDNFHFTDKRWRPSKFLRHVDGKP